MKALITALLVSLSSMSFASSANYHDPNTKLCMEIPDGFEKTWQLTQHQIGFDFLVFNTDIDEEEVSFIGVAKFDLECLDLDDFDLEELSPVVLDQIEKVLWAVSQGTPFFDDLDLDIFPMKKKVDKDISCLAYRVEFLNDDYWDDDFDGQRVGQADFHVFVKNGYMTTVITARITSDEEVGLVNEVDGLTTQVIKNIQFEN